MPSETSGPLSAADRRLLLEHARAAVLSKVARRGDRRRRRRGTRTATRRSRRRWPPRAPPSSPCTSAARCAAASERWSAGARCGPSSATWPPRRPRAIRAFRPIDVADLREMTVEISVLTPDVVIHRPGEIEIGRHGLDVRRGGARGLLLPQVAVEHGLDRETFLAATCRKAGLPANAWHDADTEIRVFEADVFGDDADGGRPAARLIAARQNVSGARGYAAKVSVAGDPDVDDLHCGARWSVACTTSAHDFAADIRIRPRPSCEAPCSSAAWRSPGRAPRSGCWSRSSSSGATGVPRGSRSPRYAYARSIPRSRSTRSTQRRCPRTSDDLVDGEFINAQDLVDPWEADHPVHVHRRRHARRFGRAGRHLRDGRRHQ